MPRSVAAQTPVPSPWVSQDIGTPAAAGSASFNQGTFTLSGSGQDIWGTADQFRFVYQPVSGDVEIIARVNSISPADPWSKSGVMIRGALSAGAPHALALVSAGKGTAFQRRTQQGGLSTHTAGPAGAAPRWVRLVRVGATVTASTSTDGATWATIGSDTIALGATAYVGMAITSHSDGILATSAVSQVSVVARSLPVPLKTQDIGAPAIPGSTTYTAGTFTVAAAGADIWDASDQFRYVYQPIIGDVDVVARVASLVNTNVWAKAGVMVRETLSANSRNAMMMLTAANVYSFQRRIDQGGFTQSTTANGAMPGWIRLVRTGSQFQAFRSADGRTWTLFATDTVPMTDAVYVGLAATSHNASRTTTAVMDNFSVKATQDPSNQPPTVALTQPASGANYTAPASIAIAATASDPESRLSRVEFFSNNARIGTDTTAPYSMTWSPVAAGTYTLTATAFDADGGSAMSQMATITVGQGNQRPTVSLTGPANNATFTAPASIPLAATASDPEGRMLRVEFYAGTTLLNSDTAAPYSFTWSSVATGTYNLKAVAYDADGNSTSSIVNTVTVTAAPRSIAFVKSSDHATLVTLYRLDIFPSGSDPATATRVASSDLGKPTPAANGEITVDRATFFASLPRGTYVATVSAVGSGGEGRGAPVTFTR